MSALAGFCDFTKKSSCLNLTAMMAVLSHRGPNGTGHKFLELANLNVGLGHKLLAIHDLSDGDKQPMITEDGNYILIFDGRLYNANDIRQELINKGIKFRSNTDTEVVLKSFAKWGVSAIDKYIGMFAFVIYSRNEEKLYLFRDRYGVKPLYYYWKNGILLFASEVKSFHQHPYFIKEMDPTGLEHYIRSGYIRAPYSIFKHTFKVIPGHFIEINLKNQEINVKKYWDIKDFYEKPRLQMSEDEIAEKFESLFLSSIRSQIALDMPIGTFFSGGYDSALITAVLQRDSSKKIKTFCVGFEDDLNEIPHARKVAKYLDTEHNECFCSGREALDIVPTLPDIYDEPFNTRSTIPGLLVSKLAKQHVNIVIGGEGESTFLGPGNPSHYFGPFSILYKMLVMPKHIRNLSGHGMKFLLYILSCGNKQRYKRWSQMLDKLMNAQTLPELVALRLNYKLKSFDCSHKLWCFDLKEEKPMAEEFNSTGSQIDDLDQLLYFLKRHYHARDRVLLSREKAATSESLELREPLTDHRLQEFAAMLPAQFKYRNGTSKYLYKKLVHKYIPQDIIEKPKIGLLDAIPSSLWLKNHLSELLQHYLSKQNLDATGLFNVNYIEDIKETFLLSSKRESRIARELWHVLMFQLWYKRWF